MGAGGPKRIAYMPLVNGHPRSLAVDDGMAVVVAERVRKVNGVGMRAAKQGYNFGPPGPGSVPRDGGARWSSGAQLDWGELRTERTETGMGREEPRREAIY